MKMKVLSVALVVCLLLAVACAEDYITRDFVQPKEGNELRIIGGHSVKDPNPYPWLVVLVYECDEPDSSSYICSGSLIRDDVVMTAAHCYDYQCSNGIFGQVTVQRDYDNEEQVRYANKVFIHPGYNDNAFSNDIALWILGDPFTVVHKFPTLPIQSTNEGLSVLAAGWGVTDNGNLASTLQQVGLEVQDDEVCSGYYGNDYEPLSEICVGADGGGRDTCQGDSGGPVFTTSDCCYYPAASVRGITSFGAECATVDGAVYADVSFFRPWIVATLASEGIIYTSPSDQCCDVCNGNDGDDNGADGGTDTCVLSAASSLSTWCAVIATLVSFSLMY